MPKPPVYYNRLGSANEIEHSVLGDNGVITGTITYDVAKFGNGFACTNNTDFIDMVDLDTSYAAGAFECWIKTRTAYNGGKAYLCCGKSDLVPPYYWLGYESGSPRWVAYFYANGQKQKIYLVPGGLAADDPAKFASGDIIHFAVSWNFARAGTVTDRVALYINNVDRTAECGTDTNTNDTWDSYTQEGLRLGVGPPGSDDWTMHGYMDNVKLYDYEKTDFSDRFNERGGLNDQAISV